MESTKSNFKVLDKKPANVLKRIQGVLSDFKTNRNGRIYPKHIIAEAVKNSDDETKLDALRQDSLKLCKKYPLY